MGHFGFLGLVILLSVLTYSELSPRCPPKLISKKPPKSPSGATAGSACGNGPKNRVKIHYNLELAEYMRYNIKELRKVVIIIFSDR